MQGVYAGPGPFLSFAIPERESRADIILDITHQIDGDLPQHFLDRGIGDMSLGVKHFLNVGDRDGKRKNNASHMRDDAAQMLERFDGADRARRHTQQNYWLAR